MASAFSRLYDDEICSISNEAGVLTIYSHYIWAYIKPRIIEEIKRSFLRIFQHRDDYKGSIYYLEKYHVEIERMSSFISNIKVIREGKYELSFSKHFVYKDIPLSEYIDKAYNGELDVTEYAYPVTIED